MAVEPTAQMGTFWLPGISCNWEGLPCRPGTVSIMQLEGQSHLTENSPVLNSRGAPTEQHCYKSLNYNRIIIHWISPLYWVISEGTKAKTKEQITFICISLSIPYSPHTGLMYLLKQWQTTIKLCLGIINANWWF